MAAAGFVPGKLKQDMVSGSDEVKDSVCSPCLKKNKTHRAKKYCVQCQEYLCNRHIKAHNVFSFASEHELIDSDRVVTGGQVLSDELTERCEQHRTNLIDMYCCNHDRIGCGTCMITRHKDCDVKILQDNITTLHNAARIKRSLTKFQFTMASVRQRISDGEACIQTLDEIKRDAELDVKNFKEELMAAVDKLESETMNTIDRLIERTKSDVTSDNKKLEKQLANGQELLQKIDKLNGNKVQEFVCHKLVGDLTDAVERFQKSMAKTPIKRVRFLPDKAILRTIRSQKKLGSLDLKGGGIHNTSTARDMSENSDSEISTEESDSDSEDQVDENETSLDIQPFLINLDPDADDDECDVTDSCILSTGTLIMNDNRNSRVVSIKLDKMRSEQIALPGQPWSVCAVDKHQAAVTIPCLKEVQIITTRKKLELLSFFRINHDSRAIACCNDYIYICSGSDGYIFVYDTSGVRVTEFSIRKKGLLTNVCSMCIDENNVIYIADGASGLMAVDSGSGQVFWLYRDDDVIKGICGVCNYGDGGVLVCGRDSHNVIRVSSNNKMAEEIVGASSGIRLPWSISWDVTNARLIITQNNSNRAWIVRKS